MSRIYFLVLLIGVYLLLDWYIFYAIRGLWSAQDISARRIFTACYFGVSLLLLAGLLMYSRLDAYQHLKSFITTAFFITLLGKIFASLFLVVDDARRFVGYLLDQWHPKSEPIDTSRSRFLTQSAVVAGTLPIAVFSFGVISGAHDYRVRRRTVYFKNLPKAFDGLRVVQISDIHTGSFFNKTAVAGGVDMINDQKADMVFFTGDLVNNRSEEALPYLDIFKKINAPMGVYSTMGNHDYGDYTGWSSVQAKQADVQKLKEMHAYMGWDLLLNENRVITESGEQIALLGVENWGAGRFSKYGNMEQTVAGVQDLPFKLLLSHDPSHWDAQIRPEYPDVDLMLSGHTHGMQFGVEIGDFRWSPSQYLYKQWADLYQQGNQYLYVNRGFGYLGYPGRVGILPEITVLELKRG
ncbi:metallophosphoesterase [Marinoscillum furvescens]|uniref:Calcineurin-like phosphoesterase domain-containing protein n=1 Tax=Marinoscillum furvescens DSM 4134 TaxID=1122208 RepID=A0A3D9L762_MARFU|nr:metallophosphoesterase [Marinoscillum furvescens]REE02188.1 hypothetical protein C7460_102212 [Marinoscillum furvescens DSM 4134]